MLNSLSSQWAHLLIDLVAHLLPGLHPTSKLQLSGFVDKPHPCDSPLRGLSRPVLFLTKMVQAGHRTSHFILRQTEHFTPDNAVHKTTENIGAGNDAFLILAPNQDQVIDDHVILIIFRIHF